MYSPPASAGNACRALPASSGDPGASPSGANRARAAVYGAAAFCCSHRAVSTVADDGTDRSSASTARLVFPIPAGPRTSSA